jgi:hypothetical protein
LQLGNPATDSTTPDVFVTLQPGYIWVGNVLSKFKNAEHGGFSQDDTHIALILSGGAIHGRRQGTTQTANVSTTQIAVTALDALGLNPRDLTGARKEHTKALPGTGIPPFNPPSRPGGGDSEDNEGKGHKDENVGTNNDSDSNGLRDLVAIINGSDGTRSQGRSAVVGPNKHETVGGHTDQKGGNKVASVGLSDLKGDTPSSTSLKGTVAASNNENEGTLQDQIDEGFWSKVASLTH